MKRRNIASLLSVVLSLSMVLLSTSFSYAHSLIPWANYYPASAADDDISFGIDAMMHINGDNVKYYLHNSTVDTYFSSANEDSFLISWESLITGTEVSSISNANVDIQYDPIAHPSGYAAVCYYYPVNSSTTNHHYGTLDPNDNTGTEIVLYDETIDYDYDDKTILLAHEFGHLWGIDDLYDYDETLNSIYSYSYGFSRATRHDRNAMRICLNDLWFNPGYNEIWQYQSSPGTFILRGDIDQDNAITAEDSRLASRYAVGLETFTPTQLIVGDVNGDGDITADDSRDILRVAVDLDIVFSTDYYEDY